MNRPGGTPSLGHESSSSLSAAFISDVALQKCLISSNFIRESSVRGSLVTAPSLRSRKISPHVPERYPILLDLRH